MIDDNQDCPCGSGVRFADCCAHAIRLSSLVQSTSSWLRPIHAPGVKLIFHTSVNGRKLLRGADWKSSTPSLSLTTKPSSLLKPNLHSMERIRVTRKRACSNVRMENGVL